MDAYIIKNNVLLGIVKYILCRTVPTILLLKGSIERS